VASTNATRRRAVRAGALVLGLTPLLSLVWRGLSDGGSGLGANPVEEITHETGEWGLRLLVLTLAVTPARRWLGWSWLAPERRTFGLLAFLYASLHFATLLAMTPLAMTSTRAAMKRLGTRWIQLHRLTYIAAGAACLHFFLGVKADLLEPAIYAGITAALLGLRAITPSRNRPR